MPFPRETESILIQKVLEHAIIKVRTRTLKVEETAISIPHFCSMDSVRTMGNGPALLGSDFKMALVGEIVKLTSCIHVIEKDKKCCCLIPVVSERLPYIPILGNLQDNAGDRDFMA